MPRIAHRGFALAILAVTAAAGLAAWIVLSSSASKPPAAEDVAVTTAQQRELLQRGSVRASIVTRGATTVALRAELAPGRDAPGIVVASRSVHVDGAGRHGANLRLTPDGRLRRTGIGRGLTVVVHCAGVRRRLAAAPAILLGTHRGRPHASAHTGLTAQPAEEPLLGLGQHLELGLVGHDAELVERQLLGFVHGSRCRLDPLHQPLRSSARRHLR